MKLYRVSCPHTMPGEPEVAQWAGTLDEVAKIKKVFIDDGVKRKDISVENIDVPTSKAELIEWLNAKEV